MMMKKLNSLLYTLRRGFLNIFHNKWYSLASVATIAACLFLLGVFYAIAANLQNIMKTAEQEVAITVFLTEDATEERMELIGKMIGEREEVSAVTFVSDDEAWETFGPQYFGENYAEGFTENPLEGMNSYTVNLSDVSRQADLITWLRSIPEIDKINYSEVTANTLTGANMLVAYISLSIIIVLLGVSIFLIHNTVVVGISIRREEINIMKYIGATDFFVRAPFVIEGILIGLIGALVPMYLIYSLYNYALNYVSEHFAVLENYLQFLPVKSIAAVYTPLALLVGVGIGFIGSMLTVRKHLYV